MCVHVPTSAGKSHPLSVQDRGRVVCGASRRRGELLSDTATLPSAMHAVWFLPVSANLASMNSVDFVVFLSLSLTLLSHL